ncbi:probable E3 ubiquitin-protein ligase HIP1 [Helianthus annuus]|uniref:probable E3 ubiquitin-protein ligase HIP1 n=1 Tax=Helianthus annuus TaxID=4232 RepID=UPI000B8F622F|nr:probable E3 ubiquitin-protein ligase HIP1 [Helianthus annuus]KAJ0487663.1 hypothetical protein HanHA89_Chr14g0592891 [Helianthus annuus]
MGIAKIKCTSMKSCCWETSQKVELSKRGIQVGNTFCSSCRYIPETVDHNSRNFFDQYRDMRLDINNMSYEERIGNVSTVFPEDNMSKYLMKKNHCPDENHGEVSCPICLIRKSKIMGITG